MDEFADWLAQLGRDSKGPVMFEAVTRGLAWTGTVVTYPGNVTTATLDMQIRAAPNSASVIEDVTIGAPVFADGKTTWALSMTAAETLALPGVENENGLAYFPVDVTLALSGSSAQRLFGGILPVSGYITLPA